MVVQKNGIFVDTSVNSILREYDDKKNSYDRLCSEILKIINSSLNGKIHGYTPEERVKDRRSLQKKCESKLGTPDEYKYLEEVTDIAGIRIVTQFSHDVDEVIELIKKHLDVDEQNSPDHRVSRFEEGKFGYMSAHLVVTLGDVRGKQIEYKDMNNLKCEIQVRSILQHAWAKIEHGLGYKSEAEVPQDLKRDFSKAAAVLEAADDMFSRLKSNFDKIDSEGGIELRSNSTPNGNDSNSGGAKKVYSNTKNTSTLDRHLLEDFISNNNTMVELRLWLKEKGIAGDFFEVVDIDASRYIRDLNYIGLYRLMDLEIYFGQNKELIKRFIAIRFEGRAYEYLYKTIPLNHFMLLEFASRGPDILLQYLIVNNIGDASEREDIVQDVLNSFSLAKEE